MRGALIVAAVYLSLGCKGGADSARQGPGATLLREDLQDKGKQLVHLQNSLLSAKERGPGGGSFAPGDAELTARLGEIKLVPSAQERLIAAACVVAPDASGMLVEFYARVSTLAERLEDHVRLSKMDEKRPRGASPEQTFAVVLHSGREGGTAFAELVELGDPVCGDLRPRSGGCGDGERPTGFQFRAMPEGPWGTKRWSGELTADTIVPLGPTGVLGALTTGSTGHVSDLSYLRRLSEIETMTSQLLEMRRVVENRLASAKAR